MFLFVNVSVVGSGVIVSACLSVKFMPQIDGGGANIAGLKFVKKCKEINFVLKVQKLVQSQNISVLFSEEISSFSKLLASLFDRQFIVSVAKVNQSNVQLLKSNFGCLCNSMEKSSIQIFLKRGWDMYLMKTSHII